MTIFIEIALKHQWKLKGEPVQLNGGYMHKMYKMDTEQGTYVVKLLNLFVMRRETAMVNYKQAEQIESLVEQEKVSILPALSFGGRKM